MQICPEKRSSTSIGPNKNIHHRAQKMTVPLKDKICAQAFDGYIKSSGPSNAFNFTFIF